MGKLKRGQGTVNPRESLTMRFMVAIVLLLVVIIASKFLWDYNRELENARVAMLEKASVITEQQKALWEFMVINQNKINYDSKGTFEYKRMNCSTVAMGVGALLASETAYKIKPTNLVCRNQLNDPDEFEQQGIRWLMAHPEQSEYWALADVDGKQVFRYMTPMAINDDCLTCHGDPAGELDIAGFPKEGWQVGDFAGALSLTMPTDIYYNSIRSSMFSNGLFSILIILSCVVLVYMLVSRILTRPLARLEGAVAEVGRGNWEVDLGDLEAKGEIKQLNTHFQRMIDQLKDLYSNLESKVDQRTDELANANDVLKHHQQELEEMNLRLQETNVYKSEFLAVMGHELRTPLSSIMAFAEMMLDDVPTENTAQRRNLQEVLVNSEILLRLINNILDLAKIEAGKDSLTLEIVDMNDIAAMVESTTLPLARNKKLQLSMGVASEVPLTIADSEKIRRIVENLVGNAIKFTDEGGRVDVSINYDAPNRQILIQVRDNGIGIKEEDQRYIFEKFTQADSSASRKHGGTGLGLTLAKELIELHGGWIKLDSRLGAGSLFTVGLPVQEIDEAGGENNE